MVISQIFLLITRRYFLTQRKALWLLYVVWILMFAPCVRLLFKSLITNCVKWLRSIASITHVVKPSVSASTEETERRRSITRSAEDWIERTPLGWHFPTKKHSNSRLREQADPRGRLRKRDNFTFEIAVQVKHMPTHKFDERQGVVCRVVERTLDTPEFV